MPKDLPVRKTALLREERRIRVMANARAGVSYGTIARDESLSTERIRRIVAQSSKVENAANPVDHNRLQIARLEPAPRLAARGIENGKLPAIGHLLKVLERLDKYGTVVRTADPVHRRVPRAFAEKISAAPRARIRRRRRTRPKLWKNLIFALPTCKTLISLKPEKDILASACKKKR